MDITPAEATVVGVKAVDEIIKDLNKRGGLQNTWDEIDTETKVEIRQSWINKVIAVLYLTRNARVRDKQTTD